MNKNYFLINLNSSSIHFNRNKTTNLESRNKIEIFIFEIENFRIQSGLFDSTK